jgi:hypothetical protein
MSLPEKTAEASLARSSAYSRSGEIFADLTPPKEVVLSMQIECATRPSGIGWPVVGNDYCCRDAESKLYGCCCDTHVIAPLGCYCWDLRRVVGPGGSL